MQKKTHQQITEACSAVPHSQLGEQMQVVFGSIAKQEASPLYSASQGTIAVLC